MKKLVVIYTCIVIVAICFSCGDNQNVKSINKSNIEKQDKNETNLSDYVFEEDCELKDSAHFLEQFKTINPEGFLLEIVYEPGFLENAKTLDSIYFCFFRAFYKDKDDRVAPGWGTFSAEYNSYPRYCFALSKDRYVVMILRWGYYSPEVIDLIIFNYREKTFENVMTLARTFGDAGTMMTDRSWFTDVDKDGIIDIITQRLSFQPEGIVGEKPLIGQMCDSIFYFKGNGTFYNKMYVESTIREMKTSNGSDYTIVRNVSCDTTFFTKQKDIEIEFNNYRKKDF